MTQLLRRVRTSPAAHDLRDVRLASPAGLAVAVLAIGLLLTLAFATRGQVATWSGFQPVPVPLAQQEVPHMPTWMWWVAGAVAYFALAIPTAVRIGRSFARAAQCCPHAEAGQ